MYVGLWVEIMSGTGSTRSKRRLSYGQASVNQADSSCDPEDSVCALCKQTHWYMSTIHSWQSTQARNAVSEYGITENDTVCRPCRDDLRRIAANPNLKPRWKKEQDKCCVKDCTDTCHVVHSKLINCDDTKGLLESTSLQFENNSIPFPTPLCAQHYRIAYSAIQPRQKFCPTCGISLKHAITRQWPNADLIKKHLAKSTGFNGTLLPEDKVCFTCYKAHLTILQEEKKISHDGDLQLIIEEVKQKMYQPTTQEEVRDLAIKVTITHVGEQLLQQRGALLLPDVHDFFSEQQNQILMANEIEHEHEGEITNTEKGIIALKDVPVSTAPTSQAVIKKRNVQMMMIQKHKMIKKQTVIWNSQKHISCLPHFLNLCLHYPKTMKTVLVREVMKRTLTQTLYFNTNKLIISTVRVFYLQQCILINCVLK